MCKKLGFGMMRLPVIGGDDRNVDFEKSCALVDAFIEKGGAYFDTSYVYHGGRSEEFTRRTVVERHPRDSFTIATKLPVFFVSREEDVTKLFETQQTNCGVDYFDYYLLHNMNGLVYNTKAKPCRIFEIAEALKEEGKIRRLGFSFHDSPEELDRILSEHPEVDFVQIALNYYDWTSSWVQSARCYETIRRHGKDVIVMEPVKGGMLAHPPRALFEKMQAARPGMSPASWALRFAAEREGVIAVLSGMSTLEQVLENTALLKDPHPLSDGERKMLTDSAPLYRAMGPYGMENFEEYVGIAANGMPVDQVLENYNSWRLQHSYGVNVCAEQCYYASLRARCGMEGSWIEGPILDRAGRDITEMVREAEDFFLSR
jgi:hypothetical protein